jgi:hypothetical protein
LPNLHVLATSCVCLEPRPLPSTRITRVQRYYGPLRHPITPEPSLTGIRLVIPDHAIGFPRVARVSLVCMLSPLPRHSDWRSFSLIRSVVSAFPGMAAGSTCASSFSRLTQRSLTLRPAHSRCHQSLWHSLPEGFRHFVSSMPAPVASGWSISPGRIFTHWKAPPLHGAHPNPSLATFPHTGHWPSAPTRERSLAQRAQLSNATVG